MKRYFAFLFLASAAALFACKRDAPYHAGYEGVAGYAYLKIEHASPHVTALYGVADNLNIYVDTAKVNGTPLKFNTSFPATGSVVTYAIVPAGSHSIRIVLGGTVNPDSQTVVTLKKTMAINNYYTLVITDSINSTQEKSQIWLHDAFPKPAQGPGYFYLRFVNAVMNQGPTDTVELYSQRRNQVLFQKITKDSTTPFTYFPTALNTLDTLYVRKKGTSTILAKLLMTAPWGDQQFYSTYFIGDNTGTEALVQNLNK